MSRFYKWDSEATAPNKQPDEAEHRLSLFTYSILAHNRSLCHHCIWEQLARNISIYQQQQAVALFLSDVFMFCCPPPILFSGDRSSSTKPCEALRVKAGREGARERSGSLLSNASIWKSCWTKAAISFKTGHPSTPSPPAPPPHPHPYSSSFYWQIAWWCDGMKGEGGGRGRTDRTWWGVFCWAQHRDLAPPIYHSLSLCPVEIGLTWDTHTCTHTHTPTHIHTQRVGHSCVDVLNSFPTGAGSKNKDNLKTEK